MIGEQVGPALVRERDVVLRGDPQHEAYVERGDPVTDLDVVLWGSSLNPVTLL